MHGTEIEHTIFLPGREREGLQRVVNGVFENALEMDEQCTFTFTHWCLYGKF